MWIQSTQGRRLIASTGPTAAQEQDRNAIAPRVEDRHRRVHEADVRVERDRERLAGDPRVAVRERDRAFLVDAEQKLRPRIAEVVDEAVVQAAEARPGRERDVWNFERAQELRDGVAAPAGGNLNLRFVADRVVHAHPGRRRSAAKSRAASSIGWQL